MNIPLAIALAVAASVLFACGTTLQHSTVGRTIAANNPESRAIGPRRLLALLRNPRWLAGLALICSGAAMHIYGLTLAPVTIVQPVGILAVPWSVLLAAKLHGYKPTAVIWGAVAMTVLGIVGFTIVASMNAAEQTVIHPIRIFVACGLVYLAAAVVAFSAKLGPGWLRCMGWASGGAILYGLSSGQLKTLTELIKHPHFWQSTLFWGCVATLVPAYLFGGWLIQQAFASGPAEIVVGSMTTIDPLVAVLFGIVVLGEGANTGLGAAVLMVLTGAIATGGVVVLSRHHPDAENRNLAGHAEMAGVSP